MNTSEQINELVMALIGARAKFGVVRKDAKGQIGQNRNYKYADLNSIIDATTDALLTNGLIVSQPIEAETSSLVTKLMHVSGQWIESRHPLPKYERPQDFGSALTYARRYSLQALLCLSADDDDGAAAQKASEAKREPQPEPTTPRFITDAQRKHLADEAKRTGWDMAHVKGWLASMGYADSKQIPAANYEDILSAIQAGPAHAVANQMEAAVSAAQH